MDAFHRYCEESSFFVSTLTMRPVGLESAFSVDLTDGRAMLRGYGAVLDAWPTAQNRYGRPGIQIGIHRLTTDSQAVFEQLLIARALASDKRETKAAARTMTRQMPAVSARASSAPASSAPATSTPASSAPASSAPASSAPATSALPVIPQPPAEPRAMTRNLPGLVRVATPPKGIGSIRMPVLPATPIVPSPKLVAPATPVVAAFENEGPTETAAAPGDAVTFDAVTFDAAAAALPPREAPTLEHQPSIATVATTSALEQLPTIATVATTGAEVSFETPTATASPMYAVALANDQAVRRSDRAPAVPLSNSPASPPDLDDAWDERDVPEAAVAVDAAPALVVAPAPKSDVAPVVVAAAPEPDVAPVVVAAAPEPDVAPVVVAAPKPAVRVEAEPPRPMAFEPIAAPAWPIAPAALPPRVHEPVAAVAAPFAAAPKPRSWWMNVRVAAVFAGGLAMGFVISLLVRPPEQIATPSVQPTTSPTPPTARATPTTPTTPVVTTATTPTTPVVTTATTPTTPTTATTPKPPTTPTTPTTATTPTPAVTAATKPVTAHPVDKPTPPIAPAHVVAKPAHPIAKSPVHRPVTRPKPKCVGLSCL